MHQTKQEKKKKFPQKSEKKQQIDRRYEMLRSGDTAAAHFLYYS
jgi:hypothetical protein